MPLVKCPDCRKEVSTSASSCPNCGRPMTQLIPCPNCRSTNVQKLLGHGFLLDVLERMAQGNSITKTYECKTCHYKW